MTAAQQHQMLGDIWPKWLAVATSTTGASLRAEQAAAQIYKCCGHPRPNIRWIDSLRTLSAFPASLVPPFSGHIRDRLIFSGWHQLANPTWSCGQIGYDRRTGRFQVGFNNRLVTSRTRMQDSRRPGWLINATNIVSQFDADALAVHELATKVGYVDSGIDELAAQVANLITHCFGAIMFEDHCLLLPKPSKVMLNPIGQLHAQREPAFVLGNLTVFAVNGEVLSVNRHPPRAADLGLWVSARRRARVIEYLGWEECFKELTKFNVERLDTSKYGTLYRFIFPNQIILAVRVKNRTKEPDGTYRHYVIPVDAQCRPLPDPNRPEQLFGAPQELTALNAVASTFYMTGAEYAATLGAES
jgi:hypothetical protein